MSRVVEQSRAQSSNRDWDHTMAKRPKQPVKAYRNIDFLTSSDARPIRILAEFLEPASRFRRLRVRDTIVFFGSSRAESVRAVKAEVRALEKRRGRARRLTPSMKAARERLDMRLKLARYYEDAVTLSKMLTEWARKRSEHRRFVIASGGGPGIMEAANLGAARGGGKSIGLNISIPTEQEPNPYISDGYDFEFHYFFMRKLWFVYLARALVIFPGGFGTMDELMEVLTLLQTKKVTKPVAIVLYGSDYWDDIVDFDALVRWNTISPENLELFHRSDDPEEAFNYLLTELTSEEPAK
jgi:uncharacterized protein (TIGR00730 family)